jgi:cytochrome c-type biogenesis protein
MIEFGPAAFTAAFAAGFLSFLSPCVLPLVPGYLSLVSGVGFDELGAQPRRVVTSTAAFVTGFGSMFVLFGAGAALFGDVLLTNRRLLEIVAGTFIVLAGLVYAGARLPLTLMRELRFHPGQRFRPGGSNGSRRNGLAAPALVGVAFGVGWTPCIGPTLAAILALAAAGGSPGQGAILLAIYSIGLGIPFLLFGLGFTRALGLVNAFKRHRQVISVTSGSVMVVFGVLLATGYLTRLTAGLARFSGLQI